MNERTPTRRSLLATLGATAIGGVGYAGARRITGGDGETTTTPPVVDEGSTEGKNARIDLKVLDADGNPVAKEPVALYDRGGTPDDRFGYTGPQGRIRFVEGVGPPPCNRQVAVLPARDRRVSMGCNVAGTTVERTVRVEGERTTPTGDPPVVDNSADQEDHTLRLELTVLGEDGNPLAEEPVLLRDRGGSPDDRYGVTDGKGRIVFLEGVGPSPCNRQTLVVPEKDYRAPLGCNDGGETVQQTVQVGKRPEPPKEPPEGPPETPEPPEKPEPPDEPGTPEPPHQPVRPDRIPGVTVGADVDPEGAPVVGNGELTDRKLRIVVELRKGEKPIPEETVLLHDRGGTPDRRKAKTGPDGRIVFLEGVGPSPCNVQLLGVPKRDLKVLLGCNDGGKTISVSIDLAKVAAGREKRKKQRRRKQKRKKEKRRKEKRKKEKRRKEKRKKEKRREKRKEEKRDEDDEQED